MSEAYLEGYGVPMIRDALKTLSKTKIVEAEKTKEKASLEASKAKAEQKKGYVMGSNKFDREERNTIQITRDICPCKPCIGCYIGLCLINDVEGIFI